MLLELTMCMVARPAMAAPFGLLPEVQMLTRNRIEILTPAPGCGGQLAQPKQGRRSLTNENEPCLLA